jgi:hypothetical protein
MNKYTFTCEDTTSGRSIKNVVEFDAVTISEIIPEFEKFLLGAGYVLPKGVHIGYVEEDI